MTPTPSTSTLAFRIALLEVWAPTNTRPIACAVLDVQKPAEDVGELPAIRADLGDELDGLAVVLSAGADAERETARCISRRDPWMLLGVSRFL